MLDRSAKLLSRLPKLQILSDSDIHKIHNASLRVLDQVGIVIQHHEALEMLADKGAAVDFKRNLAKLPPSMIEKALNGTSSEFVHAGLYPEKNITMAVDGPTHTRPISGVNRIIDPGASSDREVVMDDVVSWIRLTDRLSNLDVATALHPRDVPQLNADVHVLAKLLQYTDKPIMMSAYTGQVVRWWAEMLKLLPAQGHPRIVTLSSVNAPLNYDHHQCDLALECARHGFPVITSSPGLSGAQSPVTLAGTLVQMNAEMLAAITLIQTAYPGTPVIFPGYPAVFDLRWASASYGCAEEGLLVGALLQLGQHHGLPTASLGPVTDAIVCDQQAGYEKALSVYLSFLRHTSIAGAAGSLDHAGLSSLEQLVIDDDLFGYVRRQLRGVEVDEDTLAYEVIARVGPQNHYMEDDHTFAYMRSEYYRSPIANRVDSRAWKSHGAKDLWQVAAERVKTLLAAPEEPKIDEDIINEIAHIVEASNEALEAG
jgi:trimethylamine--corrinoid protein Co-methyltransferase